MRTAAPNTSASHRRAGRMRAPARRDVGRHASASPGEERRAPARRTHGMFGFGFEVIPHPFGESEQRGRLSTIHDGRSPTAGDRYDLRSFYQPPGREPRRAAPESPLST